ncbi:membrane carboxypeptidase [Buchnera aphidicola (Nipponaphis monzeni)]|uniref:Penicillin-binding protein 1B n=1 Tax=Buchnera aphidicola (Nipponaphis monzeni) TaxID=2495405 RepID=A0A455TA02_9GAMM|nr:penicillin-binding protein 1B [Buchnera aphidicola]BBI01178.1 membrane carboxypeptidase [Buchnera aphidicola (Nipponaphis monzeni)]
MYYKLINNKLLLLIKCLILFFLIIGIYIIYWYIYIRHFFSNIPYSTPTTVFSRIVDLEPNSLYSKQEIILMLVNNGYRNVNCVVKSGQFHVNKNSIDLFRRSFYFPDGVESSIYVRLTFYKNALIEIKNLLSDLNLSSIRIDPKLIALIQFNGKKKQIYLPINKYPNIFITMLLSIEDRRFFMHEGVNLYSIIRAFFINVIVGKNIQGGSTITQQLVKNLFLDNTRSMWRKINEGLLALVMDFIYSKNLILETYLNEVYLGHEKNEQVHGFSLASLYYFGCPINELSLEQYALLIGMLKGASLYNPWLHPYKALNRRNLVLYTLFKRHIINKKTYKILVMRALNVQDKSKIKKSYVILTQIIKKKLIKHFKNKTKSLFGIRVFTTLDIISQECVNKSTQESMLFFKRRMRLKNLEAAMVVINRFSGEIQAVLGGSDPYYLGYNRAYYARRSIGSLAKLIVYLTALEEPDKYQLNTWLSGKPIALALSNKNFWVPKNDNNQFVDKIMLIDAFVHSVNIPTVSLSMKLSLKKIVDKWKHFGLSEKQISMVPSIFLGSINLTPVEVGQIFQIIASGGNKLKLSLIKTILSSDGTLLYQNFPKPKRLASVESTFLMLYSMQEVVTKGTGKSLGSMFNYFNLAGKTGTTNNLVDSWFVGIDGTQVVVVWVGRDNNKSSQLYGASGAMEIYKKYLKNKHPKPLLILPPNTIKFFSIDKQGKIITDFLNKKVDRFLPMWCVVSNKFCYKH